MKKLIALLTAASIMFAYGCGAKTETEEETKAMAENRITAVQMAEEKETEKTTEAENTEESYKKIYLDLLKNNSRYSEHKFADSENRTYTGVLFAEIFDWNLDGVPELMVGYSNNEKISYNVEKLDVYTIKNGKAELILTTDVHCSYGALDGGQSIRFSRSKDGTLYLTVDNEDSEEMTVLGETYYTFKNGKVESTRVYAEMDVDWNDNGRTTFRNFKINGKTVTEKEFEVILKEMGEEETFVAHIDYCDFDMLIDYLEGETETYTNQFFSVHNYPEYNPSWVYDVDFGFETVYDNSQVVVKVIR